MAKNLLHEPGIAGVIVNSRDVTEQKQAEKALRESEERFRQLAENIDVVFWVCDVSITTMYYVSPAYEKIWGRTCESLMKSPRSFLDAIHPDDREELLVSLKEIEMGRPQSSVYRITRPDGAVRWISERGFPVFDQHGKVYRCVGIAEDITERRAREEQLNKLMLAIEQSPAAVVITDAQGTIEFVNPKFTDVTGYTAAEAVGKNPRILKSGKHDAEFYREFWETITAGRDWRGEFCNKKKDGTLYWESASVSAVRNERNEITNFVAVKEDITAKVRDQEQMRLQSSALSAAANSIFITDKQGRIMWVNAAFCRLSGFSMEELIDQTPRILKSGKQDAEFYKQHLANDSRGQGVERRGHRAPQERRAVHRPPDDYSADRWQRRDHSFHRRSRGHYRPQRRRGSASSKWRTTTRSPACPIGPSCSIDWNKRCSRRSGIRARWPSTISIWIDSRSSTTRWAIRWATRYCRPLPGGWKAACAQRHGGQDRRRRVRRVAAGDCQPGGSGDAREQDYQRDGGTVPARRPRHSHFAQHRHQHLSLGQQSAG